MVFEFVLCMFMILYRKPTLCVDGSEYELCVSTCPKWVECVLVVSDGYGLGVSVIWVP